MDIIINNSESKTLVTLNGRIDTTNAEHVSSQGLRIFLMLQKSVTAHGGSLVLKGMNTRVKEVFDITGFSNIIKII